MIRLAVAVCLATSALAETPMTAAEFDAWSSGHRLDYYDNGTLWGSEQHLPGRATLDADADGPCMSTGKKAKDGTACSLWSMLLYEKEVELLGQGPLPFYEQRRLPVIIGGGYAGDNSPVRVIAGLLPGTPRDVVAA